MLDAVLRLRSFLFDAVYENTIATAEFQKAADILSGLWEKVRERPDEFLDRRTIEHEGLDAAARDFIAGMTDRYAVRLFEQLFIPKPWTEHLTLQDASFCNPAILQFCNLWYIERFMLVAESREDPDRARAFEQVYAPEALAAEDDSFCGRGAGGAGVRHLQGQGPVPARRAASRRTLELPCSRCLEPFTWPVDAAFDLRYQPRTTNTGEGEREVEEDDLTTAFYENDEIDLGQLMREQFYLSLPMKPLCRDDCKGLCPQCGTNLNRGDVQLHARLGGSPARGAASAEERSAQVH